MFNFIKKIFGIKPKIKTENQTITCQICMEEFNLVVQKDKKKNNTQQQQQLYDEKQQICPCEVCDNCHISWFIEQIKKVNYQFHEPLNCGNCNKQSDLQYLVSFSHFNQDHKNQLNEIASRKFIQKQENTFPCPNTTCNNYGYTLQMCNKREKIICRECQYEFRLQKGTIFSLDIQFWKQVFNEKFSQWRMEIMGNRCPQCGVWIMKNGGCNHMTCFLCKHEYCWLCGGNWRGHGYFRCQKMQRDRKLKQIKGIFGIFLVVFLPIWLVFFGFLDTFQIIFGILSFIFWFLVQITINYGVQFIYYNLCMVGAFKYGLEKFQTRKNFGFLKEECGIYALIFVILHFFGIYSIQNQILVLGIDVALLVGLHRLSLI